MLKDLWTSLVRAAGKGNDDVVGLRLSRGLCEYDEIARHEANPPLAVEESSLETMVKGEIERERERKRGTRERGNERSRNARAPIDLRCSLRGPPLRREKNKLIEQDRGLWSLDEPQPANPGKASEAGVGGNI